MPVPVDLARRSPQAARRRACSAARDRPCAQETGLSLRKIGCPLEYPVNGTASPALTGSNWRKARPNGPSFEPSSLPSAPGAATTPSAAKLYGAIVAQARLPGFLSRRLACPIRSKGVSSCCRFSCLPCCTGSRRKDAHAHGLAQDLTDRFSADMETVLREIGVGDLSIPKKMRALAAVERGPAAAYEEALAAGRGGRCRRHRQGLAARSRRAGAVSQRALRTI